MEELNVLLVEDKPSDADLIVAYLSESDTIRFNVSLAHTLKEARAQLRSDFFNIVLLDLDLPDSSGLNSLIQLYGTFSRIPILVITGLEIEQIGRKTISMGAQGYITKSRMDNYNLVNSIMYSIERHQYIMKLRISEEELEKKNTLLSEALASSNRMFSIIGHDLKSPFNSILGLLNLIYLDYDKLSDKDKKSYLNTCIRTAKNTNELIINLLDWSRTQTGNMRIHPVNTDFNKVVEKTRIYAELYAQEKEIELQVEVPKTCMLYIDEYAIEVVLRNLLSNAVKFTNRGGIVRLEVLEETDTMATFIVEDNGTGIAVEHMDKLFDVGDSYSSPGTENEKGTGLGLLLCKELIEKNRGRIWIESEINKGTKIFFTLPVASQSMEDLNKEPKLKNSLQTSRKHKILLVEDDEAYLSYLSNILESENYLLITATNGAEAVREVLEHNDIIIILMDIQMPVMNGLESMYEIRRINPDIRIVAQTACFTKLKMYENDPEWFDDVILKPYQKNELIRIIKKHSK